MRHALVKRMVTLENRIIVYRIDTTASNKIFDILRLQLRMNEPKPPKKKNSQRRRKRQTTPIGATFGQEEKLKNISTTLKREQQEVATKSYESKVNKDDKDDNEDAVTALAKASSAQKAEQVAQEVSLATKRLEEERRNEAKVDKAVAKMFFATTIATRPKM